jgi:hypothetical protein
VHWTLGSLRDLQAFFPGRAPGQAGFEFILLPSRIQARPSASIPTVRAASTTVRDGKGDADANRSAAVLHNKITFNTQPIGLGIESIHGKPFQVLCEIKFIKLF